MDRELGKLGEKAAEMYLLSKGMKIIERNFRCKIGEIDLIAEEKGCIVFIEVKSRHNQRFGKPYEAVTMTKQTKIKRVAAYYLLLKGKTESLCRFDVISLLFDHNNKLHDLEHIPQAF